MMLRCCEVCNNMNIEKHVKNEDRKLYILKEVTSINYVKNEVV